MTQKSNAGRKPNASAKDLNTLIEKAEYEVAKFDAECCNKLNDLYAMQMECAYGVGRFKDASVTNRKSACETLIARGESYAHGTAELLNKGESSPTEETVETPPEEAKQVSGGDVTPLSFTERKEQWAAAQAKKKAAYEALKKSKEQAE